MKDLLFTFDEDAWPTRYKWAIGVSNFQTCRFYDFASVADMQAIEPLNQSDTGFRDFADPNYLRRIIAMFPNV